MHTEALEWLNMQREKYPRAFAGLYVLECGSYDVNGTPRHLFDAHDYVGVDWREGPGVDVVSLVHEYDGRPHVLYDTVISTEMLEHDPHWRASLRRMVELVAPAGYLILTAAAVGRPEHEVDCSPEAGYYRPLLLGELLAEIEKAGVFRFVEGRYHTRRRDVYLFCGEKAP